MSRHQKFQAEPVWKSCRHLGFRKGQMSILPYRNLQSAVAHALQDNNRSESGVTHHLIDACFLVPGIKGIDVTDNSQASDFYDSTNATDRAGVALFNKFYDSNPAIPYKLVLHNLTSLELLIYLSRKAEDYTKLANYNVSLNSNVDLIYADQIIGRVDAMFKGFMTKGVFPGLEIFMSLLKQGRIIGIGDYFSNDHIASVRRSTSEERRDVEGQMAQKREPKSSSKEVDVRFRVDAGVIVETAELNEKRQAGLLTTRVEKSMLGKNQEDRDRNAGIIRSPICSHVIMTAMEKAIEDKPGSELLQYADIKKYVDEYLGILLERTFIIAERTKGIADLASIPRPLRKEMEEFENTKIVDLYRSSKREAEKDRTEIGSAQLRDSFRNAGEVLDVAARGIVEKHPELLSNELLVDYDIDKHPLILNLRKRLRIE